MYANDFKPKNNGIDHRLIFVAMPFADKYDCIYNDLIVPATALANTILGYEDNLSLRPFRTKDDIKTTSGWINILENLFTAQIVMGVLTDNNQNVFYELGIAHATQQIAKQILIANKGYQQSFDIKDLIYLEYDEKNIKESIEPLANKIVDAIKTYKLEKEKTVIKARGSIGPFEFSALITYGWRRNFYFDESDKKVKSLSEKQKEQLLIGINNLCHLGLLHFNTDSHRDAENPDVFHIGFSYWWTGIGNDVLNLLSIITEADLLQRKKDLPPYLDL